MKLRETIRMAAEAVRLNKLRSLLTVLGIMIGIASVALTVGLGLGAQDQITSQIKALGSNLLIVSPGSQTSFGGIRGGFGTATTLTRADAMALASPEVAPDVVAVAPTVTSSQNIVAGDNNWTTQVVAATPEWAEVRARTLDLGRFISEADVASQSKVVVLGPTTARELLTGDPIGQSVLIDGTEFQVIGVLTSTGSASMLASEDDSVIMPWTTASATIGTSASTVQVIYIEAKDQDSLSAAYQQVYAAMATRHNIIDQTPDFTVTSQQSIVSVAETATATLTMLLGGLAGISLLVGGIGVMNIMLVSVSERVREIGLRKALGAKPNVIRGQFLTEAAILGLAGGIAGLILAFLGAWALTAATTITVRISWSAIAASLAVALGVGLIAGVYPAGRAARLAPIDALRRE